MEEDRGVMEIKAETVNGICQDLTCRLCLFRHKDNTEVLGPTDVLAEYITKHLSLQIGSEDEFPMWICKFCQQSLESFHNFYSKVAQIQDSLLNLFSALKETSCNVEESPRLNAEFEAIETTVGFGRGKIAHALKKLNEAEPSQRMTTRNRANRARKEKDSKECALKQKKDKTLVKCVEETPIGICSQSNKRRVDTSSCQKSIGDEDNIGGTVDDQNTSNPISNLNSDILPDSETNSISKDEDLSSLEDQDWVGQGFNFDVHSSESGDDSWKPPASEQNQTKTRKRKRNNKKKKENGGNSEEISVDDPSLRIGAKKAKFRITATHGTEPKPKVPPEVQRMLREEMKTKFVEFYGITCDICVKNIRENSLPVEPVKYDSFGALCDHMQGKHNVRGYVKCCNCTMREKKRAERHMLLHTQPGSIFKCNICGKQLSTQQSFRSHILLHLPDSERPFQCTQCERGFATKPDLTLHERQHLPEDKKLMFTCDICGSRFGYETGLLLHKQRVHDNNRPHLCDLCAKSFKSRCDMERHKAQIHGNVKREQCPECGKWIKGKTILKTHMRQHKGAKFPCQFCDKVYTVRSSWKAHLLTHSDEKPHKCPVCDKSFKLPGTLKMHLNQHTGEHPYSCPFCPKTFASSGNYYTHRKRMHPNEVALLKEATEAALAANGIPPPSVPPLTTTHSMSEAIARTKEKVAAKAKAVDSSDVNVGCMNAVTQFSEVEASEVVSLPPTIFSEKGGIGNAFILSQGSDSNFVLTSTESVTSNGIGNVPSKSETGGAATVQGISNNFKDKSARLIVPNGVRIVRIISPEGTAKFALVRKCAEDLNNASIVSISPQPGQVVTDIIQEHNDSSEMPAIVMN